MDSVKEAARAAQNAAFEQDGESEAVMQITADIYNKVDALSDSQKTLLVRNALTVAHQGIAHIATQGLEDPATPAYLMLTNGLLAVAGYTNEVLREQAGETTTSDAKVTEVLELFHRLVQESARDRLSPEVRDNADAIIARVQERVARGENPEEALHAEYDAFRKENPSADDATPAPATEERYGMYL